MVKNNLDNKDQESSHLTNANQENSQIKYTTIPNTEFSSSKVKKAALFLLLPEIENLFCDDKTKIKFLQSKDLSEKEINEVLDYYNKHKKSRSSMVNISKPFIYENDVINQKHAVVNVQTSFTTSFYNLVQKLCFYTSIVATIYFTFRTWLQTQKQNKKEKKIEDELNTIKIQLNKLSSELKENSKTKSNVLNEINSLKAILVGRQYFEEKQESKLNLPSWQLKKNSSEVVNKLNQNENNDT